MSRPRAPGETGGRPEWNRPIAIEAVRPQIDGGRFAIKRTLGEGVVVEADIFCEGPSVLSAVLMFRHEGFSRWSAVPMAHQGNDRFRGEFTVVEQGRYLYTIQAWVDRYRSWVRDLRKRVDAAQDASVDLLAGADMVDVAARQARGDDRERLHLIGATLRAGGEAATAAALSEELGSLMDLHAPRHLATRYEPELPVIVDRERAQFGAWYELFPRSGAMSPGHHGTFRDLEERLGYVAGMGFDVLYFPPIHPIGRAHRKGKNNTLGADDNDPGSPWAIGAPEGGHTAVHAELGTLEDFRRLVARAGEYGMEIALDLAFQCSPDHPYVREHPSWFRWRPDGTIQYAENPPKKYQDILPLDFETEDWPALWEELKHVVLFWITQGVRILRVDNPHTKPFAFWEWLIAEVKREYPDAIFLSEAFTRPKVMYALAKLGFTQSYTYFAWRNTKKELTQYFTELTQTDVREFFRPNLWPNTPDILTEYLQTGGRPAFMTRLILAATLGASYGIYGPAFELQERHPLEPGSEEYLDSEKYEIRRWDLDRPDSLRDLITRVNRIRRENPALHADGSLRFHQVDNDQLICYSKQTPDLANVILTVVNLDPHHSHSGWVELPLADLGIAPEQPYAVWDLLTDTRYLWSGPRNFVLLDPAVLPAHIFLLRRRLRQEQDFEYFL